MTKRFRIVATVDAQEGMVLYDDSRDRAGNLLLPKHCELTGAMIRSLLLRNVDTLRVVDESVTAEQLAAECTRMQARLDYLCRYAGNGRANTMLRKAVEQYRTQELS